MVLEFIQNIAEQSAGESPVKFDFYSLHHCLAFLKLYMMQSNTRKKRHEPRMLKINAITKPEDDWYSVLPEIKLSGEWLKRLGFEPGQKVTVISSQKMLVIQLVVES